MYLIFLIILCPLFVFASASTSDGHQVHIPDVVLYQFINVVLLAGILFYFLRKKIVEYYRCRESDFYNLRNKALQSRIDAETNYKEIKDRLEKLQSTADDSVQKAKTEAEALYKNLVAEVEELSEKMKQDMEKTAQYESEKTISILREDILNEALIRVRSEIASKIDDHVHNQFRSEFVDKIRVLK